MTWTGSKKDRLQARNRHEDCPFLSLPVSELARPIIVASSAKMHHALSWASEASVPGPQPHG